MIRPVSREGIDLGDDGVIVAVIFRGGHHAHGAVAGAEDDDGDHQGGGETGGVGVGSCEGHCPAPDFGGDHSPLDGRPKCFGLGRGHRAGEDEATARFA